MTASNLILDVHIVSKDGGSYCVRCPHCKVVIGIDGEDMSEIRGEQFEHRWLSVWSNEEKGCKGWFEVARNARFVRELPSR